MIDFKYADLYKQNSVDKQLNIAFDGGIITNEDIHSEQFELTESLCSDSQLRFGSCEASMIKFRISNIFTPLKDKWLTVTETLNHNTDIPFQFGKYKVYSDIPTADRRYRDVVAYDKMYDIINADVSDWYNALLPDADRTTTVKAMRDSFMSHFGIEQEEVELINDSMVVQKTIQPTTLSGKDVITAICEINGCFGHIGRNGKFQYITLKKHIQGVYPSNDLYPADNLYPVEPVETKIDKSLYISCEYEDYLSHKIDRLIIRQKENDVGSTYPNIESGNTYIVQDNFLVYGKSSEELNVIASNLYSVISDTIYRPFKAKIMGNPCIEVGDAIRFNTKYEIVESYVLNRTLTGIQALRDNFSANGNEYFAENVNSVESKIIQLKSKTNTLERNVDETKSQIADVEQGLQSQITQTAESITSTISKATSKYDTTGQTIDLYGYGSPTINAEDNINKHYLDQSTGILYTVRSHGGGSYFWDVYSRLPLITDNLSSRIEQTVSGISLKIDNGEKTAGIVITLENEDGTTSEVSGNIEMTGTVTFSDLANDGQTVINGSNITTGTLDAEKVNVINVNAKSVSAENITGSLFKLDGKDIIRSGISATEYGYEKDICLFGRSDLQNSICGFLDCIVDSSAYNVVLSKPYNPGEGMTKSTISFLCLVDGHTETFVPYLEISTFGGYAYTVDVWSSDTKLKKNIKETNETALDKIREIDFIQFDWKSNDNHVDLGVSADQIRNIIPKAIIDVEQPDNSKYDKIKNISSSVMTTYALKAIQEQQEIIDNQQKEIDELKKSVSFLMQKIGGADNE